MRRTLASLAQAFLKASDAHTIERFLRAGHHDQAAKRFCERFSERQFPLEYAHTGRGELIVESPAASSTKAMARTGKRWATCGRSSPCSCCRGR